MNQRAAYMVTVSRPNQFFVINPPIQVLVDGMPEITVKNGSECQFPVKTGLHMFTFRAMGKSKDFPWEIVKDFRVEVKWDRVTGALEVRPILY